MCVCVVVVFVFMVNFLAHWQIFRPLIRTSFQILHFLKCHVKLKNLKGNFHVSLSLYRSNKHYYFAITHSNCIQFHFLPNIIWTTPGSQVEHGSREDGFFHLSQAQRVHGGERVYPENALRWPETYVPHYWGWAHLLLGTIPPPCPPYIFKA